MDASLSQSPWQPVVSKGVGGSILAELLHTCCLNNKGCSRAASCGEDAPHVTSQHMWSRTDALRCQARGEVVRECVCG